MQITSNDEIIVPSNSYEPCSRILGQLPTVTHSNNFGKELYHSIIRMCGDHRRVQLSECVEIIFNKGVQIVMLINIIPYL